MSKVLFLMSGGYGEGKTYFAHQLVGVSNTVSLASPIRSDLFKIFLNTVFHEKGQDVKDSLFSVGEVKKALKRSKVSNISKPVWDNFYELLDKEDLTNLTVRAMLKFWGEAGRAYRKDYWVNRTIKLLEGLNSDLIAVDDVRFINEKEKLCKWAGKNGMKVQHYFVGCPDEGYENTDLCLGSDYKIHWR